MKDLNSKIGKKNIRRIDYLLPCLFGKNAFEPASIKSFRKYDMQYFAREVRLTSGHALVLTDKGIAALREIGGVLKDSGIFLKVEPSDISSALREVFRELLSNSLRPNDAHELIELVKLRLDEERKNYWFAVPVNGLDLDGVESVRLGDLTLRAGTPEVLYSLGAKLSEKMDTAKQLGKRPCLFGCFFGTEAYAKRIFGFRAGLAIGIVSTLAAMSYEAGAAPFRITLEMTPDGARAAAKYVFWCDEKPDVTHVNGWTEHQTLRLGKDLVDYLEGVSYIQHALGLGSRDDLSQLESALVRSLFWYSDAQRDNVHVMQLVKYWSCAESIFSSDGKSITRTVSEGVAASLCFGGFGFKRPEEFEGLVRQLVVMYGKRSKAVHEAQHSHVTWRDTATLSQWTAYMILAVLALIVEQGYKDVDEVRSQTRRLAGVMERARDNESGEHFRSAEGKNEG